MPRALRLPGTLLGDRPCGARFRKGTMGQITPLGTEQLVVHESVQHVLGSSFPISGWLQYDEEMRVYVTRHSPLATSGSIVNQWYMLGSDLKVLFTTYGWAIDDIADGLIYSTNDGALTVDPDPPLRRWKALYHSYTLFVGRSSIENAFVFSFQPGGHRYVKTGLSTPEGLYDYDAGAGPTSTLISWFPEDEPPWA